MLRQIKNKLRLLSNRRREPYLFWRKTLGFTPGDIRLYQQAMRHRSVCAAEHAPSNERLEYVGDAMLSAIVGDLLYQRHPKKREGYLTLMRSKLVKRETLNYIAQCLRLDTQLHHALKSGTAGHDVYGNAFEALIGAIYYDKGYKTCYRLIERIFFTNQMVDLSQLIVQTLDYKSELFKLAQHQHVNLTFEVQDEQVEKNLHTFTIAACWDGQPLAVGTGHSKREAEQKASATAIHKLGMKIKE
ncbi:MAG: ribonuclease III [Paludibacteraceae bacterium]|nr:ribonuclease III [Paludibacteraceae bacterium]